MHGRQTDWSYRIRWRERDTEKGRKVRNEMRKGEICGTYIIGVKDLASAYVLCPRLVEYGGLSIYGRTEFTEQRRDCEWGYDASTETE